MISIINNIDRHNSSVRINICFAHATADMIVATIGCTKRQIMCLIGLEFWVVTLTASQKRKGQKKIVLTPNNFLSGHNKITNKC